MSLIPASANFTLWKGATFRKRLTLLQGGRGSDPRNLTNFEGLMEIRDKKEGTVLLTLDETGTNDGTIIFGGINGTIDLLIDAGTTSTIPWTHGVYDLTITAPAGGDTDALLYGGVSVKGI